MGGANNRSLISAHFCISAYFLTAETYKRMRLTTRVYGIVCFLYKLAFLVYVLSTIFKLIIISQRESYDLVMRTS